MAAWLSQRILIGLEGGKLRSERRVHNQRASLVACERATNSASIVERAMEVCFLEDQEMAPPESWKT